jgi:predicted porin
MKKILLSSAALVGVAFAAAPAMAQVDVTVGGHTKNYIGYLSQDDTAAATEERNFDMIRESELHFNAEGTADNGLTYGFHVESEVDGVDGFAVEESYLYLSSNMGRVNLGSEDGAAYLLQVAAPSADANVDGLRQYIQPVNYGITAIGAAYATTLAAGSNGNGGLDYDNDLSAQDEKITYLSPNWSGFQFGLSYTPETVDDVGTGLGGFNTDNTEDNLGSAYEGALRYEGTFNNIGFAVGAGYSTIDIEENIVAPTAVDDPTEWNVGADFDIGAFGIGAVWTEADNVNAVNNNDSETFVLGGDYTTGPFQFGVSYLNQDFDVGGTAVGDVETDRYTGGVVYTVTQGLTLRGSISFVDHEQGGGVADVDATSVLGGVQFNF